MNILKKWKKLGLIPRFPKKGVNAHLDFKATKKLVREAVESKIAELWDELGQDDPSICEALAKKRIKKLERESRHSEANLVREAFWPTKGAV